MRKSFLSIPYLLLIIGYLALPFAASAAVSLPYFGGNPALVSCTNTPQHPETNCTVCDLFETGQRIIYFIMTLTLFVVGPIMVTAGGIMMLIAAGNESRFSDGKKMATGAIIGILIALVAFLIVNTLLATIARQIPGFSGSGFTISCSGRSPLLPPSTNQSSPPTGTACPTGSFWIDGQCKYGDNSPATPIPIQSTTFTSPTGQQCTEDAAGNVTCQ